MFEFKITEKELSLTSDGINYEISIDLLVIRIEAYIKQEDTSLLDTKLWYDGSIKDAEMHVENYFKLIHPFLKSQLKNRELNKDTSGED